MEPGFAFPCGPKDAMLAAVNKNHNPGPSNYYIHNKDLSKQSEHKTLGKAGQP
jgi:hypothetical protein